MLCCECMFSRTFRFLASVLCRLRSLKFLFHFSFRLGPLAFKPVEVGKLHEASEPDMLRKYPEQAMAWADAIVHSHHRNNYARVLFVAPWRRATGSVPGLIKWRSIPARVGPPRIDVIEVGELCTILAGRSPSKQILTGASMQIARRPQLQKVNSDFGAQSLLNLATRGIHFESALPFVTPVQDAPTVCYFDAAARNSYGTSQRRLEASPQQPVAYITAACFVWVLSNPSLGIFPKGGEPLEGAANGGIWIARSVAFPEFPIVAAKSHLLRYAGADKELFKQCASSVGLYWTPGCYQVSASV